MKHALTILALVALFVTGHAQQQTTGYGAPLQLTPQQDSALHAKHLRASYHIRQSADLELTAAIVGTLTVGGGYYLMTSDVELHRQLGTIAAIGGGIASCILLVVANRHLHQAGVLLENIQLEQNGITIRL